jgi:hypothetical protein
MELRAGAVRLSTQKVLHDEIHDYHEISHCDAATQSPTVNRGDALVLKFWRGL